MPFKGNVDLNKLEAELAEHADKIPFIIVTITNNTAGGQPVSMENLRGVRKIADKYNKRVVFDSARFAENAYFIKMREPEFKDATIKEMLPRNVLARRRHDHVFKERRSRQHGWLYRNSLGRLV